MFRILLIFFFFVSGCSSRPPVDVAFHRLERGMIKGDVLELMGSPVRTTRKDGMDVWHYYMAPEDPKSIKVIHFFEGKLAYRGKPLTPLLSADEMEELKKDYKKTRKGKKQKPYKRSVSDKQLKKILKKEVENENQKKDSRFEEI